MVANGDQLKPLGGGGTSLTGSGAAEHTGARDAPPAYRQGAAEAGSAGPQGRGRTGSGARSHPDVFFPSRVSEGTVHPAHARSELYI